MRRMKMVMAVLAVLVMAGIASAQTTMELKGQIRVYPEVNNYGFGAVTADGDSAMNSFVDQRARLFFNLKSGDNLGGTVAFEIDTRWGDQAYQTARNKGGALEADTVNLETKNAFMWFKPSSALKLTLGIQGLTDAFKGVILGGADAAGVRADYALSKDSSLVAGWFLFSDAAVGKTSDPVYFIPITFTQKMGDSTLGVSYYRLQDNTGGNGLVTTGNKTPLGATGTGAAVNYLGASYAGKAAALDFSAFLLYNFGTVFDKNGAGKDGDISAYVLNADVSLKMGAGKAKAAFLYAQGGTSTTDVNGVITGNQYATGADLPLLQNDLYLVLRTLDDITHSTAFFTDLNNSGLGATVLYGTYDQNLNDKTNVQVAVGYGKANEKTAAGLKPGIVELNVQAAYKFSKELTIKAAYAYGMLSDVKSAVAPVTADADNIYRAMLKFQYAF